MQKNKSWLMMLVAVAALTGAASAQSYELHPAAKYSATQMWHDGPTGGTGDYEGHQWDMGIQWWTKDVSTIYRGVAYSTVYTVERQLDGSLSYATTFLGPSGGWTTYDPFTFTPEESFYSCSTSDGLMTQIITVSTKFFVQHSITHIAQNPLNCAPQFDTMAVQFAGMTKQTGCTYVPPVAWTFQYYPSYWQGGKTLVQAGSAQGTIDYYAAGKMF